ncbi:hypothetical protein CMK12_05845 [Candidatus Poribacteria bacterium]|nr:hypothetical protein [Candidatus Poribacteria bacterium]
MNIKSSGFSLFCILVLLFLGCESPDNKLERLREELDTSKAKEERLEVIREITNLDHQKRSSILLTKLSDVNFRQVHSELIVALGKIKPVHSQTVPILVEKLSQTELRNDVAQALKEIGDTAQQFLILQLKGSSTHDDAYYALSQMAVEAKLELVKGLTDESYELRGDVLSLLQSAVESTLLSVDEIKLLLNVFDMPPLDYNKSAAEFTTVSNILALCSNISVPALMDSVGSEKLQIRAGSAMALYEIDKDQRDFVLPVFAEALKDPFLCDRVVPALVNIGTPALPVLEQAFNDEASCLKAAEVLGQLGATGLPILSASLTGDDVFQKQVAIEAMGKIGVAARPALNELIPLLKDIDLGESVAITLGSIGPDAVPHLVKSLNSKSRDEQRYAMKGLSVVNPLPESVVTALTRKVPDPNLGVEAIAALTKGKQWQLDGSKLISPAPYPVNKLELLDDWWVIEPFDNSNNIGFDTAYSPERKIDLKKEHVGKNSRRIRWYQSRGNGTNAFSNTEDNVVGYAVTTINSDRTYSGILSFGWDDDIKIWLNGDLICTYMGFVSLDLGTEAIFLPLRKGENELLLKVGQSGGGWGFRAGLGGERISLDAKPILGALRKGIQHKDPVIRDQSQQAFEQIGVAGASILVDLVTQVEKKSELRAEIIRLLGKMSSTALGGGGDIRSIMTPTTPITTPLLLDLIADDQERWEIRQIAYDGLFGVSKAKHPEAVKAINRFEKIRHAHDLVQSFRKKMTQMEVDKTTQEILQVGEPAVPFLIQGFTSEVSIMRGRSANTLARMGKSVTPALKAARKNGNRRTTYWVDYTLAKIK